MTATYDLFEQPTSKDSASATSSPESAGGLARLGSPDGETMRRSGLDHVHANHSLWLAKKWGRRTRVTFGRSSAVSFASADLQLSLASRLRTKLDGIGSPLFSLTWKRWAIPQQEPICALRASARTTFDNVSTGWVTPNGADALRGTTDSRERRGGEGKALNWQAALASWPTAAARDWKSTASNKHDHNARPLNEVARLASWVTPNCPRANDSDNTAGRQYPSGLNKGLEWQASGAIANGSLAGTEVGVQLNPDHSRWLMGYPVEWGYCGATAMQLFRKSRSNSSKPIGSPERE